MPRGYTLALVASLALVAPDLPAAAQTTIYVDGSGTPPGSGTQLDPFTSIQAAIDAAGDGDTIEVSPGTYVEDLVVSADVLIRSTGGPVATVIHSDGTGPAAVFFQAFAELEGFTVTGVVDPSRPGVQMPFPWIGRLTRCIVANNAGNGVQGEYDGIVVRHSTIAFNQGSGLSMPGGFTGMNVMNSIVRGNGAQSQLGGAFTFIDYTLMQGENCSCFGPNVLSVKAQLWSREGSDFHLKPGSPAIDAGSGADPDGSPSDLGALTFDPTHAPLEPETYCTSKVNSQGCTPQVQSAGAPSISAGGFTINCAAVLNNKTGLFFYGFAGKASPYQGGYLCVVGPVRRTAVQDSGGNPPPDDCSGLYAFDFGALLASGADPALVAGQGVFGQFWYRDPNQAGPNRTGRSEGIGFLIAP